MLGLGALRLVHRRHFPVDHYVLIDERGDIPAGALIAEARERAETLAAASTGSRNRFTLIYNGSELARRAKPHVHIICARSRTQKALVYFYIALRNLYADLVGAAPH